MGKYDALIADAKVALTDAGLNALNADNTASGLKLNQHLKTVRDAIPRLEGSKSSSLFGKLKEAMFDTQDDMLIDRAARQLADAVYQLAYCLKCKCANCPASDEHCRCDGCRFGAYVKECDRRVETRRVDNGVITVDEQPALQLVYDRGSGGTVVTVMNGNGTRVDLRLDLKTGRSSPL
jgi:hypothetical protein